MYQEELESLLQALTEKVALIRSGKNLSDKDTAQINELLNDLHKSMFYSQNLDIVLLISKRLIQAFLVIASIPVGIVLSPIIILLGVVKSIRKYKEDGGGVYKSFLMLLDSLIYGLLSSIVIYMLAASMIDRYFISKKRRLQKFSYSRLRAIFDRNEMFHANNIVLDNGFSNFMKKNQVPVEKTSHDVYKECTMPINDESNYDFKGPVWLCPYTFPTSVLPRIPEIKGSLGNHSSMTAVFQGSEGQLYYLKQGFDFGKPAKHDGSDITKHRSNFIETNIYGLYYLWRSQAIMLKKRYNYQNKEHLWQNIIPIYYPGEFDCHTYTAILLSNIPLSSCKIKSVAYQEMGCARFGGPGSNWHSSYLSYLIPQTPVNYLL